MRQMVDIGYYSLPVVGLTAIFTGMVLALQSHTGFSRFEAESAVATIVVLSMTRELGPVLAGLMVAGRVGASMAAELGTMRVTEQIDALTTLSTSPFKYLVWPRVLAGFLMLPLLVLVADIIGVLGGFIVGVYKLGFGPIEYLNRTFDFLETEDVDLGSGQGGRYSAFIVALMGCYQGYQFGTCERPGRGGGDHPGGGVSLNPDPHGQLYRDRDLLQPLMMWNQMSTSPKISHQGTFGNPSAPSIGLARRIDLDVPESASLLSSSADRAPASRCCSSAFWALMEPDAGSILIDDQEMVTASVARRTVAEAPMRKFGMLFQGAALFDSIPVWENVTFGSCSSTRKIERERCP